MLILKTSDNVRTGRSAKGFRSCWHSTGDSAKARDRQRVVFEEARRQDLEARRLWLSRQWAGRFENSGERLRVLPPSACFGRK